jgi:hypothetical protein
VYRFVRMLANDELISDQGYGRVLSTGFASRTWPRSTIPAESPEFVCESQKPKPTNCPMNRPYDSYDSYYYAIRTE